MRIDLRLFEKHIRDANGALSFLSGLAPWVMATEALREVRGPEPKVPDEHGSALVLCVWRSDLPQVESGLFSRAFGLPLRWVENETDSPMVPQEFVELAGKVREELDIQGFGLALADELEGLDLSGFPVSPESAFAPLAASLYLVKHGGKPLPTVLATGRWSERGIGGVEGIAEKVEAGVRLAGSKGTLYVPAANFDEAVQFASSRLKVQSFPPGDTDIPRSLQGLLAELDAPPPDTASLEERLAYGNRSFIARDRKRRSRYYQEKIVGDLAALKRAEMLDAGSLPDVDRLVLGVSFQWELAVLLINILQPRECRLLCTEKSGSNLDAIRSRVETACPCLEKEFLLKQSQEARVCEQVAKWLDSGERAAVEITGGTKEMSTILLVASQRSRARILYLRHTILKDDTVPKYGTERIDDLAWARGKETKCQETVKLR